MTTHKATVGKGRRATHQLITTKFSKDPDGRWREHVTLQTPRADDVSETQRLRLLTARDLGKGWPTAR